MKYEITYFDLVKRFNSYIINNFKKILYKSIELVFTGIIFAVVASLLTTYILENIQEKRMQEAYLKNISNIYIGCNKLWVDESFGSPQFVSEKEGYLLCAYISDFSVVQLVFDQALSAQAYLITSLDNKEKLQIEIEDTTFNDEQSIKLGNFSYYDFPSSPESIYGFVTNGNARVFYSEKYYFTSSGNYYNYYIASFDFGSRQDFLRNIILPSRDEYIDDEVNIDINEGVQIIGDRHNSYPNTYGVSNINNIEELLFGYDWFNSQQLRNKLEK